METHRIEQSFKCKISGCGMAFNLAYALKNHMSNKHCDERPVTCNFPGCLFAAKTSSSLCKHMAKHSNRRPFLCPAAGCNYRAKRKGDYVRHQRSVHSETKLFGCSECDYKAAEKGTLSRHTIIRHSSRRDFKCSHPQQAFKTLSQLKNHFSNRHGERNVQCSHPDCETKFANNKALSHRKWIFHSKKTHVCPKPNCCYRTNQPAKLARHITVHDRMNEMISCSIQGCKYKERNSKAFELHLHRHKNKTHQGFPVPGSCENFEDHPEFRKQVKPFWCPLCFENYASLNTLQSHFTVHTNEKPFKCGHCEYESARRFYVKRHILAVHANIKFPFIVRLLDDRECLRCKMILPSADFAIHCMSLATPAVMLVRMQTRFPDSV